MASGCCSTNPSDPPVLVRFSIWERGDVVVEQLKDKLRCAVHNSLCDLVTEYSILTAPLAETGAEAPAANKQILSEPTSPQASPSAKGKYLSLSVRLNFIHGNNIKKEQVPMQLIFFYF